MDYKLLQDFLAALFIGTLVGIERERRKAKEGSEARGLRSFILIAEAGAVSAYLSSKAELSWIFPAALFAIVLMNLAAYFLAPRPDAGSYGLTTEIATVVVFLLGGMALSGHSPLAIALAVVTSVVLAYKEALHGLVAKIGTEDLYAILKLLAATFIVLPLLPDRTVDPLDALNPYKLWLLVILISGLSLVGYVAIRWLGQHRGTAITGLTGGLVSSTAVTLFFAKSSREEGGKWSSGAFIGILLAWSVMFVRVIVEVLVVHRPLVREMVFPFAAMTIAAVFLAALANRRKPEKKKSGSDREKELTLKNPFSLTSAIQFAALFALVLVAVKLAQHYLPGAGVYVVAALAGSTDVDAITLSMAQFAREGGDPRVASTAITIAALVNTSIKAGIVALASPGMRKGILLGTALILATGTLALYYFN